MSAPELVLSVLDIKAGYVDENVLHGVSIDVPTRRSRCRDRAEWLWQVDAAQGDLQLATAARRLRVLPRQERHAAQSGRPGPVRGHPPWHQFGAPASQRIRRHVGA